MNAVPKLITPGVIAAELGEPIHRILYILRTRSEISPVARAGTLRLYDRKAVLAVEAALRAKAQQESEGITCLK